jgi:hypothetical protein
MGVLLVVSVSIVVAENRPQVRPIDDASRIRLANSTHIIVASSRDLGRVDPKLQMEQILLILSPADNTQPALHNFSAATECPNYAKVCNRLSVDGFDAQTSSPLDRSGGVRAMQHKSTMTAVSLAPGGRGNV